MNRNLERFLAGAQVLADAVTFAIENAPATNLAAIIHERRMI